MSTSSVARDSAPLPRGSAPPLAQLLRSAWGTPAGRARTIGASGCLALYGAMFAGNLRYLPYVWRTDENYSHGFLVPLLALYFANEAARKGAVPVRSGIGWGLALLIPGLLGKLATMAVPVGIVSDLSMVLGLAGLCGLLFGREALRRYAFPLFFLVFMVPLPVALYAAIASPLQLLVSRAASGVLEVAGIPVLRQGNLMTLPGGVHMFVAEACSGMRQLTGFLALTAAVAYLAHRPWWHRALIVAAAVPVAMTANVVRVVVTGLIMYHLDPRYASGSFHTVEGLLMMGLGLMLLWGLCGLLDLVFPTPSRTDEAGPPGGAGEPSPATPGGWGGRRVALAGMLLVPGLASEWAIDAATATDRPELARPLASLPMRLGTWQGHDEPVRDDVLGEAQADDYLSRVYEDTAHPGRSLTLWINYSRYGLNMRHSPEVCLPSGGWSKVESECRVLEIGNPAGGPGGPMPMSRLAYRQGEVVQYVGFWYYIFGEGSVERFIRRLPITSRSSHGRTTRGSGLTVEVFCPGAADPDGSAMGDFSAALLDALTPILPDDRAQYHVP